jgi:hypothetical protein
MDNSAAVGDRQGFSYMASPFTSGGIGNAALGDDLFERLTLYQFHYKIRGLCGLLNTHVMDSDDGWMRKLAYNAGFAKKMSAGFATGELRGKQLNGYGAVDERVMTTNDAAMSANAKSFMNLVAANFHGW